MITVSLTSSDANPISVSLPREKLLLYPNSVFGSALQFDPTLTTIEISNSAVTPKSLLSLQQILTHDELPLLDPSPEYAIASEYLGINELLLLSESTLPGFRNKYPEFNVMKLDVDGLYYSIDQTAPYLARYLFLTFSPGETQDADTRLLYDVLRWGKLDWVDQFLRRSPNLGFDQNVIIRLASERGYTPLVRRLLQNSDVDPTDYDNLAIKVASSLGHADVVDVLLADPRVNPSHDRNYALRFAATFGHVEVVNRLLRDPRVNPTDFDNNAIVMATICGRLEVVERLLLDPRVKATYVPRNGR